jgi:hypothetical protein
MPTRSERSTSSVKNVGTTTVKELTLVAMLK